MHRSTREVVHNHGKNRTCCLARRDVDPDDEIFVGSLPNRWTARCRYGCERVACWKRKRSAHDASPGIVVGRGKEERSVNVQATNRARGDADNLNPPRPLVLKDINGEIVFFATCVCGSGKEPVS